MEGKRSHHCTAVCPSVSPRPPLPLPLPPTGSPCWDPHQAAIDSLKATMPLVPGAGVSIPGEHWPVGILAGSSLSDPCLGAVAQRESTSPLCSYAPFFHERKPTLFPPPWLFYGFRACDLRDLGSQWHITADGCDMETCCVWLPRGPVPCRAALWWVWGVGCLLKSPVQWDVHQSERLTDLTLRQMG